MENPTSLKRTARTAGLIWIIAVVFGAFPIAYVRSKLIVPADAALTAANLSENELLFRLGIASALISLFFFLFLGLTLFRLFREEGRSWSNMMLAGMLVSIVVSAVNIINNSAAIFVLGGSEYLRAFTYEQLTALSMLFLRMSNSGLGVSEVFMGVFMFSLGALIIRTAYVPRVLGALLICGALAFLVNTLNKIIAPQFYPAAFTQTAMLFNGIGVPPAILWLLIMGAKKKEA